MDKLYTIIEVAAKLNLSDKTLRRWEEAGRFTPSRTLGNQRRYSLDDLQVLDAIKHGVVNEQKDLLTLVQASKLCGVSPTTISRWENEGKIHPLITSGNTYYPRHKLMEKMDSLKTQYPEPRFETPLPVAKGSDLEGSAQPRPGLGKSDPQGELKYTLPIVTPKLKPLTSLSDPQISNSSLKTMVANILITVIILVAYHLIFNQTPTLPANPGTGVVQGVATTTQDPRVDDLLAKFQDHLSAEMLEKAKPVPVTTINLDNTALIYGTSTLSKGKNQITVEQDKITSTTPVTVTFTGDYAPAKKYWVTTDQGSFTLYTDFPVSSDSTFNYSFLNTTTTITDATNSAKPN
ncbi:MerR family transcriptional regulator [Candidatus Woesebacteria bacterium]|nr:MerR family transcriptional regulator [Candidatus Woesebacteria bacterium]